MMLNQVTQLGGAHKTRKRVGRGESSGWGKTCTRGNKGCQSRAGGLVRPLTEGGQMPIFRRLPKRGFSNVNFRLPVEVVNVADLEQLFSAGDTVNAAALIQAGLVSGPDVIVKVLGSGSLTKKLTVECHAFSRQAQQIIEQAGGTVTSIAGPSRAEKAKAKHCSKRKAAPAKKPAKTPKAEEAPAPPAEPAAKPDKPAAEEKPES